MFRSINFLLACLLVCVAANRAYPPVKVLKLTLGVSKATYLPFPSRRFIQNGHIIENPSTTQFRNVFWPPQYNPTQDKIACRIRYWTAKSYENKETEVLVFKNAQQKLAVFGFRGTEPTNIQDWLKNFDMLLAPVTIDKTTFHIHKGFRDRFGSIATWFEREYRLVPHDYTIVITGHSLGGAEATIAAVHAAGKLKRRPDAIVTFGSPLVGAQNLRNYYHKVVGCDRTLRIAAKGDPFTHVPIVSGYTHVCSRNEVDGKTGLNLIKSHGLYGGYEQGIRRKYSDVHVINVGCDRVLT